MGEVNDVLMEYLRDNVRFADLFNGILFGGESVIRAEELYEGSEVFVEKFVWDDTLPERQKGPEGICGKERCVPSFRRRDGKGSKRADRNERI